MTARKIESPIVSEWRTLGYKSAEIRSFDQSEYIYGIGGANALSYLATSIGLLIGAIIGWHWLLSDIRFKDFYAGKFGIINNISIGAVGSIFYLAVIYVCFAAVSAVFGKAELEGHPFELAAVSTLPEKILLFAATVFVALFAEEFMMCGVILGKFVKTGFPIVGVIFSSVIFAVSHPMPIQIITHHT